jgi:F-type H+-transporting ATPase subunit b
MKKPALALLVLLIAPLAQADAPGDRPMSSAQAAPSSHAHQRRTVHPVAAPSSFELPDPNAKAVEEEGPPDDVKVWDTKIFNNEQPPLAALLFNFALLVLIYYRYGKKPVVEALKNRKISIASAIENAQRILREAKERSKRYRNKLEKAQEDADQGKQALVSTGKGEAELILREGTEKAERLKREAVFLAEQEKKQTELDLMRETVEKATKEAQDILQKSVSRADQERLGEEFIAKLVEKGLRLGSPS